MKTFRKLFTVLLLPFAVSPLCAQNGITISDFSANVGAGGATLTFNMEWDRNATNMPAIWRDSAWVFADYNNAGTVTRLQLTGATLTATSAPDVGKVIKLSGNNNGVWVVGNAKEGNSGGAFSATVQLHTPTTYLAGACVYAINYPPVGQYETFNTITLKGSPPFELTFEDDHTESVPNDRAKPYSITAGTLKTFTDASGAPGFIKCKAPDTQTLIAASSYCSSLQGVDFSLSNTEQGVIYELIHVQNQDVVATRDGLDDGGSVSFGRQGATPEACALILSEVRIGDVFCVSLLIFSMASRKPLKSKSATVFNSSLYTLAISIIDFFISSVMPTSIDSISFFSASILLLSNRESTTPIFAIILRFLC
jgi:hypothetical protein